MKLLEVKVEELSGEVERARGREQDLRKELLEAQQASQAFETKAAAHAAFARDTATQRRDAVREAEAAAVRLREEQMKLERELQARRQADEQAAFLVRENAKLKTALAELSISAERLASDHAQAQQDNDSNKMARVVSRWMIRKMHDKLTVTLVRARGLQGDAPRPLPRRMHSPQAPPPEHLSMCLPPHRLPPQFPHLPPLDSLSVPPPTACFLRRTTAIKRPGSKNCTRRWCARNRPAALMR